MFCCSSVAVKHHLEERASCTDQCEPNQSSCVPSPLVGFVLVLSFSFTTIKIEYRCIFTIINLRVGCSVTCLSVRTCVQQNLQQQSLDTLCCCSNWYQYRYIISFFTSTDTFVCIRCDFHEYERNLTAITVCIPCIAITLHSFHLLPQATTAMKDILEGLISLYWGTL